MYELIIYLTLAGSTDLVDTFQYPSGMDCAYNHGVWVQHYINEYEGIVLEMGGEDIDKDGQYDFTQVQLVISNKGTVGTLDLLCVNVEMAEELRAQNE